MNIYLFHYIFSLLLISITSLTLGLFVYFKNRKGRVNQAFLLFSLSVAVWSGFQAGIGSTPNKALALFCTYPEHVGIIIIPSTFIYFIYNFLEIKKDRLIKLGFALSLFFLIFLPTKLFIKGVNEHMVLKSTIEPGPLYLGLVVFLTSYMALGLKELFVVYTHSTGAKRNQMKYLFWGYFLTIITGTSNFLYLYKVKLPLFFPLVNYGVPFYVFATTYAIVKYRLMDISVVISRTVIYSIIYSFSVGIFTFLIFFFGQWLIAGALDKRIFWLSMLALFLITIMVRPLDNLLIRITDKVLFRRKYEYQKTLREASAGMVTVRDLNKLLNLIVGIISKHVRVMHATIFISDNKNPGFRLCATKGRIKLSGDIILNEDNSLIWWLNKKKDAIVFDELNSPFRQKSPILNNPKEEKALEEVIEQLEELKTSVCVPSFFEGKLIGFLLLGEKLSGDMYTQEDLDLFMTLANHAASSIENCWAYEELKEKEGQLIEIEKLAAIGRLAGNIAHEIKNPLAPIKTYTEFLDERIDDPNFRQDFKKVLLEEVNRIDHIVQTLINYSHPKKLKKVEVDIRRIIKSALHLLENDMHRQKIKVIQDYDSNSHTILADGEQLKQVFLNLFLNSLQALENIHKTKELRVKTHLNKDSLTVEIQDTGCGIKKEELPFIFDPFFSTKEKGSGLGLSIVQSIIKNHGGTILVESEVEAGTTFTISLPK